MKLLQSEDSSWQFWKDNSSSFSNLTQMTRDVLSCSVSSVDVERVFNLARRVCTFDRAQMNEHSVKQFIMIKYYNRIMNMTFDDALQKSWNIFRRKQNENEIIDETANSFKEKLSDILQNIEY